MAFSNSVEWKLRDNVEWSIDMESEVFIDSLCLRSIGFVQIENSPLLMSSLIITENSDFLSLFILSTSDIKDFAALPVDKLFVFILEYLEPS
jgi:hypothetical protein